MNIDNLLTSLREAGMSQWADILPPQIEKGLSGERFGDLLRWQTALKNLPEITADHVDLNSANIAISSQPPVAASIQAKIREQLQQLKPWRKGPYSIHGVHIDTEWRSDLKWDRLRNHVSPLHNRIVLDIGCGSGYHGWRMIGAGARLVIGIDPSPLFIMQFQAIKHFAGNHALHVLPLGIESVPEKLRAFDSVFSMGVLYHRRSPIDHLLQCRDCLKPGGELVLETLVIEGDEQAVFMPRNRYAKMRNVWFIPSASAASLWLQRSGFIDVKIAGESVTTTDEQRRTEWMQYESLSDFLDAGNPALTVEGYPAPRRALLIATAT
ncbi:MAG: tRNA (mo5U34)-methyltransferase [Pseudomonadota bacterium]|nr:tRNA (mo5U34)-methyltransferase [Pseudomonadota bacterium]